MYIHSQHPIVPSKVILDMPREIVAQEDKVPLFGKAEAGAPVDLALDLVLLPVCKLALS